MVKVMLPFYVMLFAVVLGATDSSDMKLHTEAIPVGGAIELYGHLSADDFANRGSLRLRVGAGEIPDVRRYQRTVPHAKDGEVADLYFSLWYDFARERIFFDKPGIVEIVLFRKSKEGGEIVILKTKLEVTEANGWQGIADPRHQQIIAGLVNLPIEESVKVTRDPNQTSSLGWITTALNLNDSLVAYFEEMKRDSVTNPLLEERYTTILTQYQAVEPHLQHLGYFGHRASLFVAKCAAKQRDLPTARKVISREISNAANPMKPQFRELLKQVDDLPKE